MSIVIPFPNRSLTHSRLLTRDKIELCVWETTGRHLTIGRVVIHEGAGGDDPNEADLVLFYAEATRWAQWGLARQDNCIVLWHCGSGADLGVFRSMRDALAALDRYSGNHHDDDRSAGQHFEWLERRPSPPATRSTLLPDV